MKKISICIPIYNFDVRDLVLDLKKEIHENQISAEIILIDDASKGSFCEINKEIEHEADHFIFLEKNVGRSQIRNLFLYYSDGDFLLFLDCDGKIISPNFIKNYLDYINTNKDAKVIYGGRTIGDQKPHSSHMLRWKFAKERENLPLQKRIEEPFLTFQTNNFLIEKKILERVNFNPEFQKYGYEDLLFSMDLKSADIKISHIDNVIFNNDLESNDVYLKKVEESVESLHKMLKNNKIAPKIQDIKLVKAYLAVISSKTKYILKSIFEMRKKQLRRKLLSGTANLSYLDFYKLGLMLEKD